MRRLTVACFAVVACGSTASAQDGLPSPTSIVRRASRPSSLEALPAASSGVQEEMLAAAEKSTDASSKSAPFRLPEPGPFGGNGALFTGWSNVHAWQTDGNGGVSYKTTTPMEQLQEKTSSLGEGLGNFHQDPSGALKSGALTAAKSVGKNLSITVASAAQNGLSIGDPNGTGIDLAHADESFQVGLTGVAAQVDFSVADVHARLGDVGVEADALTAKARLQLSLTQGVDLQAGATLIEGSADLGGVKGSLGFGVGAQVGFSANDVGFKIGLGIQVSVGVNPMELVHTVGDAAHDVAQLGGGAVHLAGDAAGALGSVASGAGHAIGGFFGGLFGGGGEDPLQKKIDELAKQARAEAAKERAEAAARAAEAAAETGEGGFVQRIPHSFGD